MRENETSMNILFICYGNVCRSPMAEYICRDMIAKDPFLNQDGIKISSAGIQKNNGLSASDQTIMVMMERGLNQITRHKGQEISAQMLHQADLILTMEDVNKADIIARFPDAVDRTFLLSEYAGYSGNILDPTGKSTEVYGITADTIHKYLTAVVGKLRMRANQ